MQDSDRTEFAKLMTGIAELYDKEISETSLSIWWASLKKFDFDLVQSAISQHIQNPEAGHFMPKPADIIRQLEGTTQDKALAAWSLVEPGIRGRYNYKANHVKFADPVIHMVVSEMGGFSQMGLCKETDLHWVQKEFMERYSMRCRMPLDDYPPALKTGDYLDDRNPDLLEIGPNIPRLQ